RLPCVPCCVSAFHAAAIRLLRSKNWTSVRQWPQLEERSVCATQNHSRRLVRRNTTRLGLAPNAKLCLTFRCDRAFFFRNSSRCAGVIGLMAIWSHPYPDDLF